MNHNTTDYKLPQYHSRDNLRQFTRGNMSSFNNSEMSGCVTCNVPYQGEIKVIPLWEVLIKVFFYSVIIILALVGNTLVIFIVWRNKRMRTTTNYYLVNLAVSDLLVTLSCTWVHLVDDLTEGWVLGSFFCTINSFAQVLALISSILTLTLIACDRFFGIVFAMKAHVTQRRAKLFIALVWIIAVAISSPLLAYRVQEKRQWQDHLEVWCMDNWPVSSHVYSSKTVYYTIVSVMLYFLPVVVMSVAYTFIIWKLWITSTPGEQLEAGVKAKNRLKKKVVLMLIFILLVFAVCWLPFQIAILYTEYRPNQTSTLPNWYNYGFNFFANFIAFANSAFNPIIYTGFNANFRKGFQTLCKCRKKKRYPAIYSTLAQGTPKTDKRYLTTTTHHVHGSTSPRLTPSSSQTLANDTQLIPYHTIPNADSFCADEFDKCSTQM